MFYLIVAKVQTGNILSHVSIPNPRKINIKNGDSSMNKTCTGLYKIGSVLKPLIMAIGLDVGEVSMTNLYDATNLKIGQHQIQDNVNYEGLYLVRRYLVNLQTMYCKNRIIYRKRYYNSL